MIGSLKHRISLESAVSIMDGEGGETLTWQAFATVWAAVEPKPAPERVQDGQVRARRAYRITIRYRDDVSATDRVQYDGVTLDVLSVVHLHGDKAWTELDCIEV